MCKCVAVCMYVCVCVCCVCCVCVCVCVCCVCVISSGHSATYSGLSDQGTGVGNGYKNGGE